MSKMVKEVENKLYEAIENAVKSAIENGDLPQADIPKFIIEKPADKKNGDFSSNIAMAGARAFHGAPRMIAEAIVKNFSLDGGYIDRCEIAGPGFINFYLSDKYYSDVLKDIVASGDSYGR